MKKKCCVFMVMVLLLASGCTAKPYESEMRFPNGEKGVRSDMSVRTYSYPPAPIVGNEDYICYINQYGQIIKYDKATEESYILATEDEKGYELKMNDHYLYYRRSTVSSLPYDEIYRVDLTNNQKDIVYKITLRLDEKNEHYNVEHGVIYEKQYADVINEMAQDSGPFDGHHYLIKNNMFYMIYGSLIRKKNLETGEETTIQLSEKVTDSYNLYAAGNTIYYLCGNEFGYLSEDDEPIILNKLSPLEESVVWNLAIAGEMLFLNIDDGYVIYELGGDYICNYFQAGQTGLYGLFVVDEEIYFKMDDYSQILPEKARDKVQEEYGCPVTAGDLQKLPEDLQKAIQDGISQKIPDYFVYVGEGYYILDVEQAIAANT